MDSSSSTGRMNEMKEEEEETRPHVLVVDDSLIDRKIMEKLFTNSACKGDWGENLNPSKGMSRNAVLCSISRMNEICQPKRNEQEHVTTAESGQKALELLGQGEDRHTNISGPKINLVVTDYCMPGMTGYDLLKKVKESSGMKEIPVIVVSSENVPTRIEKCLKEGAQEFILKPLKQSDVKKLRCHMQFTQPIRGRICLGR